MSPKFIFKVNDSVANSFWKRKSTQLANFELQRRTSNVILTQAEKTQETSDNSFANSKTKVTFSSMFKNHFTEHETNHATLDVPCNTDTIKLQ